jgi:hypothetical protein
MSDMKRLTSRGRALVTPEFLAGQQTTVVPGDGHVETVEEVVPLSALDQVVKDCMTKHPAFETGMDQYAAVELHKALKMSRRLAGDLGVWHYLAVVKAPAFVRHRWGLSNGAITENRFLGNLVKNTFARLWWGAELTVNNGNYADTQLLFSKSQDLYEQIFGRAFCRYPGAVRAFLKVVGPEPEKVFRRAAKDFNHVLTTVVLEALGQQEIEALLKEIVAEIKSSGHAVATSVTAAPPAPGEGPAVGASPTVSESPGA